ncbi:hypothetical protein BURMUCF2_0060 [Burkholderia multivorans CF2]|nr:hypothetical protein BURMUCGD1_3153 [Burkholderia multivorans CGD1]EJO51169.1 hypothetical protein BURMUCF2_0060 [Burkholderia multivorans CF2]
MPPGALLRLRGWRRGRRRRGLHRHTGKQSRDYSCPPEAAPARGERPGNRATVPRSA